MVNRTTFHAILLTIILSGALGIAIGSILTVQ